jgi:hypothetical protein
MDTARQVLRFSIPGSITLLLVTGFLVLGRLLQHDSWDGIAAALRDNVSAAVAIFAAIPLGFVIYQIYYSTYRAFVWPWPWPWASDEHWVRIDRGAQILSRLPADQLGRIEETFGVKLHFDGILKRSDSWVGSRAHAYELRSEFIEAAKNEHVNPHDRYRRRWQLNWNVVRALVEISDSGEIGGAIKSEYTILSDLYHALGACRTGVQLAWATSTLAAIGYVIAGESVTGAVLTIAATTLFAAILFWVFHRTRGNTWSSAQAALALGLTGLFKRQPELLGP